MLLRTDNSAKYCAIQIHKMDGNKKKTTPTQTFTSFRISIPYPSYSQFNLFNSSPKVEGCRNLQTLFPNKVNSNYSYELSQMYLYDLEKPETFGIPNRVLRNTGWNRIPHRTSSARRPTPKLRYKKCAFYKGVTTYLKVKFVEHFMGKYEARTE